MTIHRVGYTLWPRNFDLVEPEALLDEAEEIGVDTVEIPLFATRLVADGKPLVPAMRLFEAQMKGRALGYTTHALLTINLMDEPDRIANHECIAKACIEISARFNAPHMVLHCGSSDHGTPESLDQAYGRQRNALARLGDFASEHGVMICVENIWNFDGRETALPGRLATELRQIDHPFVRATLDYAHAALQCSLKGADLMEQVSLLSPLAHHLHLNDCFGKVVSHPTAALRGEALAYGHGDLHLPLGWGNLDWRRLLGEPEYPGRPILNVELHPDYWSILPQDVAETRRLAALMAR